MARTVPTVDAPDNWVATLDDGSQILVRDWGEDFIEVATRKTKRDTWGPPEEAVRA